MTAADVIAEIKVIDVDTHVVEPYDLWTSRVSTQKWGDRVPHVVWHEQRGEDVWMSGSRILGAAAAPAVAGFHKAPPNYPARLSDAVPSTYRTQDRLKTMDEYGIYAQILYPNVAGFGGGRFANASDGELNLLLVRAYNDYLTDLASEAPGRLIPIMALPFWDIDLSIAEMERCKVEGHRGVIMSQQPDYFGQPVLSDPAWDRLWAAAQDMELPVNFHIGGGDMSGAKLLAPAAGHVANYASFPATFFVNNCRTVAMLIGGGICHRFPRLNFVSVESGVGWLPFALQALDWMWVECRVTDEHPEYELLPSEYFQRQILGCFWFEHGPMLDATIETLGADNIMYETDFPHPTSMSPGPVSTAVPAKQFIAERLGHLEEPVLRKILHDTAARVLSPRLNDDLHGANNGLTSRTNWSNIVDDSRYKSLDISRDGGIVTVTINRPAVRNAIDAELHDEFGSIFADLDHDDSCDVVVLTGAGESFSAGGDLNWILSLSGDPIASAMANRVSRRMQNSLLDLKKPIIAKVRGHAVGLGCSLALFCDFVYATPDARFADPHVAVGLVAGDGGALIWPQLIGYARARRHLLTGDPIRGADAADLGLITAAVAPDELDDTVDEMAARLAHGAKWAIRYTKSSINAGLKLLANGILDRAAAFETVTQMTNDNRAALEAILNKESPTFTGT